MGKRNKARSNPQAAQAAQAVVVDDLGIEPVTTVAAERRVPCYWDGCDRTFAMHGAGAMEHSSCDGGRVIFSAIRKLEDGAAKEAKREKMRAMIAEKFGL